MRTWTTIGAAAVLALTALAARAEGLELGDEAPDLEVTGWVQGEELQISENPEKRVRVVQFFNTYDQGCVRASKDLEKLHTEMGPKGVDLVAVTTQAADAAEEFLAKHPVTYRVAVDQYNNTNAAFMKGVHRLPFAFVIDREGRIAWTGAPEEGLRKVVEEVVEGTYDVDRARKIADLRNKLFQTLQKRKPEEMAAAADALLEVEPSDGFARSIRLSAFEQQDDVEGYRKWMEEYAKRSNDEAETLSWMAWRLVSSGDMAWRMPGLAFDTSTRALELTERKNADMLDTHARVLFELGLLEQAVAVAKESVAIDENDDAKARLAHYESCLELRKKVEKEADKGKRKRR